MDRMCMCVCGRKEKLSLCESELVHFTRLWNNFHEPFTHLHKFVFSTISKFIVHLTPGNVWESMGKPCSCTQYFCFQYKSHETPYWYYKSCALHLNVQGSCVKIIVIAIPEKNITCLLLLALLLRLRTRNNTDSNKRVIFSGIALYYGDANMIYCP